MTKVEPDSPEQSSWPTAQVATVRVEQSFKGVTNGTFMVFDQGSDDCSIQFKRGERWLFYADYDREDKTWSVSGACGRSAREDSAQDDLLYLRALPDSATRTRISGSVQEYEDTPDRAFAKVRNVPGVRVKITGEGRTYELLTDKNGVYEIYDLPPGNYSIKAEAPPGMVIRFPMRFGGLLKPNTCIGSDFLLSSDTKIGGTVFGANGEPLPNACVNLEPAKGPVSRYFNVFSCTDGKGRYELTKVAPGKYFLVANDRGQMSPDTPFPKVYYPSVFDKDKAAVVTISGGEKLDGYDIHIPVQQPTSSVSGVLLYSDGQPIADQTVQFTSSGEYVPGMHPNTDTMTDSDGHFSLNGFSRQRRVAERRP